MVAGFDEAGNEVAHISSREEPFAQGDIERDLNRQNTSRVLIELRFAANFEDTNVALRINGHSLALHNTAQPPGRMNLDGDVSLSGAEWRLITQYLRLSDQLAALSRAVAARSAADSLSGLQCSLLFAAIECNYVACGFTHDPISCEGFHLMIQHYQQECHGGGGTGGHVRHVILEA